jgi:hypothetical protein
MERPDGLIELLESASDGNIVEVYTDGVKELLAWIRFLESRQQDAAQRGRD